MPDTTRTDRPPVATIDTAGSVRLPFLRTVPNAITRTSPASGRSWPPSDGPEFEVLLLLTEQSANAGRSFPGSTMADATTLNSFTRNRRRRQGRISRFEDSNDVIARMKGDRFHECRRLFEAYGRGEINPDYPADLSSEAIDYCNYARPYCPRAIDRADDTRIDEAAFSRIVDEFAEGMQGLSAIGFDSGEPVLDEILEGRIACMDSKGTCDIIVTTNAVDLTPDRARKQIEAGAAKLGVPLDADTQETYTKRRGGTLENVERSVRGFVRIGEEIGSFLPTPRCGFVESELDAHEIESVATGWAPVVDYVEFQDCIDRPRLDALCDYPVEPFWCHYPFESVALNARGDICPCCSFCNEHLVFGRVADGDTVGGVLNGERQQELRRQFKEGRDSDIDCRNCHVAPPASLGIESRPLLREAALPPRGKF